MKTEIPKILCGTDYRTLNNNEKAEILIYQAIKAGFRGFDSAWMYRSEPILGSAVNRCITEKVVKREDLFIQTKPPYNRMGYNCTLEAFEQTLDNLHTAYLDAYLIHQPLRQLEYWKDLLLDTWSAMEKLCNEGKIRYIGFCNFLPHHFDVLMSKAHIKPSICQMQLHPQHQQKEMVDICRKNGIVIEAYSPLYGGRLCSSPIVTDMAQKYTKSPAQILLNWHNGKEIIPVTKPCSQDEIDQDINSLDFKMETSDINVLDDMDYGTFENIHTDNGIGFPVNIKWNYDKTYKILGIPFLRKTRTSDGTVKVYLFNMLVLKKEEL